MFGCGWSVNWFAIAVSTHFAIGNAEPIGDCCTGEEIGIVEEAVAVGEVIKWVW